MTPIRRKPGKFDFDASGRLLRIADLARQLYIHTDVARPKVRPRSRCAAEAFELAENFVDFEAEWTERQKNSSTSSSG